MPRKKTLFQQIMEGKIPGKIEYEDEHCIVLHDISPQAPIHLLIIPKKPIARISLAQSSDAALLGHLLLTAKHMAKKLNCRSGFRIAINNGRGAGETVPHLHLHFLAGRPLKWPPG